MGASASNSPRPQDLSEYERFMAHLPICSASSRRQRLVVRLNLVSMFRAPASE